MHTAESDSAVCIIPRSRTPQCASYRGVKLRSVHHTTKTDSGVCITPLSHKNKVSNKAPWCASHCGVSNLTRVCFYQIQKTPESRSKTLDITLKIIL